MSVFKWQAPNRIWVSSVYLMIMSIFCILAFFKSMLWCNIVVSLKTTKIFNVMKPFLYDSCNWWIAILNLNFPNVSYIPHLLSALLKFVLFRAVNSEFPLIESLYSTIPDVAQRLFVYKFIIVLDALWWIACSWVK